MRILEYSKSIFLVIFLIILVGLESIFNFQLQSNYNDLYAKHEELQKGFVSLQTHYNELNVSFHVLNASHFKLQNQYSELQVQYEDLNKKYLSLKTNYQDLILEHRRLQNNYDSLKESYNSLQKGLKIIEVLRIGNSLESYYDYLREELGATGAKWWWLNPDKSYWQTEVDFAANLAMHDLRWIYWPSIEKDYYEDVGEYSYDTARKKIDEILALIEIKTYDAPTDKIRKILDFIHHYIHYETEVNDIFLAPVETLGFRSGDCDDLSILAAALFEAVGIDSAIGFFVNENNEYHAMVLVHLEDLSNYGYWYYSDLTSLGLEEGRWIKIEPQTTIDNQDDEWIGQWKIFVAAPLDTD